MIRSDIKHFTVTPTAMMDLPDLTQYNITLAKEVRADNNETKILQLKLTSGTIVNSMYLYFSLTYNSFRKGGDVMKIK